MSEMDMTRFAQHDLPKWKIMMNARTFSPAWRQEQISKVPRVRFAESPLT